MRGRGEYRDGRGAPCWLVVVIFGSAYQSGRQVEGCREVAAPELVVGAHVEQEELEALAGRRLCRFGRRQLQAGGRRQRRVGREEAPLHPRGPVLRPPSAKEVMSERNPRVVSSGCLDQVPVFGKWRRRAAA